jgi:hypothetical protein
MLRALVKLCAGLLFLALSSLFAACAVGPGGGGQGGAGGQTTSGQGASGGGDCVVDGDCAAVWWDTHGISYDGGTFCDTKLSCVTGQCVLDEYRCTPAPAPTPCATDADCPSQLDVSGAQCPSGTIQDADNTCVHGECLLVVVPCT